MSTTAELVADPQFMGELSQVLQSMAAEAVAAELRKNANRQAYGAAYAREGQPARYAMEQPTKTPGRGNQAVGLPPSPPPRTINDMQTEEWEELDVNTLMSSHVVTERARRILQESIFAGKAAECRTWEDCLRLAHKQIESEKLGNPVKVKFAKAENDATLVRYQRVQAREKVIRGPHPQTVHAKARQIGEREIAAGRRMTYDDCLARAIGL